jgi:hypothetical protein
VTRRRRRSWVGLPDLSRYNRPKRGKCTKLSLNYIKCYKTYQMDVCSVNDRNRFIRRLFAKRKLTQTSPIVQYCQVLPDLALLYGPKIGGPRWPA